MADFYLKNADASRVYRLEYAVGEDGAISVSACRACAAGGSAWLPNKTRVSAADQPVDVSQVLIDYILAPLVPGTVEEYRACAKAMIDTFWT